MRLSRQSQAHLFIIFFYNKSFERKQAPNARQMTLTLLETFGTAKNCSLCCLVFT